MSSGLRVAAARLLPAALSLLACTVAFSGYRRWPAGFGLPTLRPGAICRAFALDRIRDCLDAGAREAVLRAAESILSNEPGEAEVATTL